MTRPMEPDGKIWIVWVPRQPKVGDAAYYAELGEPIPSSTPKLNLQLPCNDKDKA